MKLVRSLSIHLLVALASVSEIMGAVVPDDMYEYIHHDHPATMAILKEVNKKCPDITRLYNLSETSVEGRELAVIEMTENPGKHVASETCFCFIFYNFIIYLYDLFIVYIN